jgi:hypothetical protein
MSIANPETLKEWVAYVATLTENVIVSKASAANSKRFTDKLLAEGFSMTDIKGIMQAFAKRFVDLDLQPPAGIYDMVNMTTTKEVKDLVLPDPSTIAWEPEPDEVDRQVEELDLETKWDE